MRFAFEAMQSNDWCCQPTPPRQEPTHMTNRHQSGLCWERATGMTPSSDLAESVPQCAFVPDTVHDWDHVAVVYDKGQNPPKITIREVSDSVHTVLADGIAVAVIARTSGPVLSAADVLLVERST